jgi:putative oxidoreductase
MEYLELFARLCLALIFSISGAYKILQRNHYRAVMTQAGFPVPLFFLAGAIFMLLGGGLGILLGWNTRFSAAMIVLFLIIASAVFHVPLLKNPEPGVVRYGQDEILKNLAMIGGLLKFAIDGAGPLALDHVANLGSWRVGFYVLLAALSSLAFFAQMPEEEPEPAAEGATPPEDGAVAGPKALEETLVELPGEPSAQPAGLAAPGLPGGEDVLDAPVGEEPDHRHQDV